MRRNIVITLCTIIGTAFMSLGFTLFVSTPPGISYADDAQEITPFEDYACLDCHTDQSRLTELADSTPEEEESSLSSGPG